MKKILNNVRAEKVANRNGYFRGDVWTACLGRVFTITHFNYVVTKNGIEVAAYEKSGYFVELSLFKSRTVSYVFNGAESVEVSEKSWRLSTPSRLRRVKKRFSVSKQRQLQLSIWVATF